MVSIQEIKRRLWDGANELRGSMDASRYKDYMLGLMFYKFLSDRTLEIFRSNSGLQDVSERELVEEYKEGILRGNVCIGNGGIYMSEEKKIISFMVVCVNEFAKKYNISAKEAFQYLFNYKGIEFLKENYEVEHTLSFDNVVEDISILCRRNGGIL